MMKPLLSVLFFGLFIASWAHAQTVNQSFTVTWDYSDTLHTGFHIERMPTGGTFAFIATVPATSRSFIDSVTGSPGEQFSWRLRAFNAEGNSSYSAVVTAAIAISTPPAPTVKLTPNQCSVVLTGTPPDTSGGWTAQFKRGASTNIGSLDSTSPYTVTVNLAAGSYDFWIRWTKTGQTTRDSLHAAGSCP